jgi:hypothetical protein
MLGSSRVAAQLAASREGLGSMSDDDDDDNLMILILLDAHRHHEALNVLPLLLV